MNTSKTLSRRTLAKGTAWAAPVVLASSAIPAYASSVPDCSWLATQNVVETSVSNEFSDMVIRILPSRTGGTKGVLVYLINLPIHMTMVVTLMLLIHP